MYSKFIIEFYQQKCHEKRISQKKIINFSEKDTLDIILENNRHNNLTIGDFDVACQIIKECSKLEDQIKINFSIIGLKIKEQGIYTLMNLTEKPLQFIKFQLINIGLEETNTLVKFFSQNQLIKPQTLQNLDLSGNNIQSEFDDLIEILEKQLSLKHLQLNYCNLNNENIDKFEKISQNEKLVSLQLEGNQFNHLKIKDLLSKKLNIVFINLANNNLGNQILQNLQLNNLQSLELSNCKITNISKDQFIQFQNLKYLGLNQNRLGSKNAYLLIELLKQQSLKIDVIKLDNNKIGNRFIKSLHSLLRVLDPNNKLFVKQISLKDNLIDDEVFDNLKGLGIKLDLENNYIQQQNQKKKLEIMDLSAIETYFDNYQNIRLTILQEYQKYQEIVQGENKMKLVQQELQELQKSECGMEQWKELSVKDEQLNSKDLQFLEQLLRNIKTIYRLNFENVKISDEDLGTFLQNLKGCENLVILNLRKNSIRNLQIKLLIDFLKTREKRVDLNLEGNELEDSALSELMSYIQEKREENKLMSVKVGQNRLRDIKGLVEVMKGNSVFRVQDVVLDGNQQIGKGQLGELMGGIKDNHLLRLSLKNLRIDDELMQLVVDKLANSHTNLQYLHLDGNAITKVDPLIKVFRQSQLEMVTIRKNNLNIQEAITKLARDKLIKHIIVDEKQYQLDRSIDFERERKREKDERERVERLLKENLNQVEDLLEKRKVLIRRQIELAGEKTGQVEGVDGLEEEKRNLEYLKTHGEQVQGVLNMETVEVLQAKVDAWEKQVSQLEKQQMQNYQRMQEKEVERESLLAEQQDLFKHIELTEGQLRGLMGEEHQEQAAETVNQQKLNLVHHLQDKTKYTQEVEQILKQELDSGKRQGLQAKILYEERLGLQLQKHSQGQVNVDLIHSLATHFKHLETIDTKHKQYQQDTNNSQELLVQAATQQFQHFQTFKQHLLQEQQLIQEYSDKVLRMKQAQQLSQESKRLLKIGHEIQDYSHKIDDLRNREQFLKGNLKTQELTKAKLVKIQKDIQNIEEKQKLLDDYDQKKYQLSELLIEIKKSKQDEMDLYEKIIKLEKSAKKKLKQQQQIQRDLENSRKDADLDTFQKLSYVLKINQQTIQETEQQRTQFLNDQQNLHQQLQAKFQHIKQNYNHILDFVFINDWKNKFQDKNIISNDNGIFELSRIITTVQSRLGVKNHLK